MSRLVALSAFFCVACILQGCNDDPAPNPREMKLVDPLAVHGVSFGDSASLESFSRVFQSGFDSPAQKLELNLAAARASAATQRVGSLHHVLIESDHADHGGKVFSLESTNLLEIALSLEQIAGSLLLDSSVPRSPLAADVCLARSSGAFVESGLIASGSSASAGPTSVATRTSGKLSLSGLVSMIDVQSILEASTDLFSLSGQSITVFDMELQVVSSAGGVATFSRSAINCYSVPLRSIRSVSHVGIKNPNTKCYLISVVQAYGHLPVFREHISRCASAQRARISERDALVASGQPAAPLAAPGESALCDILQDLYDELEGPAVGAVGYVEPTRLIDYLTTQRLFVKINADGTESAQDGGDSSEFLGWMIDELTGEIASLVPDAVADFTSAFLINLETTDRWLSGISGAMSRKDDFIGSYLPLAVQPDSNVPQLIESRLAPQRIRGDYGEGDTDVDVSTTVKHWPTVFTAVTSRRDQMRVTFPETLNLSQFGAPKTYKLHAVLAHTGDHYLAYLVDSPTRIETIPSLSANGSTVITRRVPLQSSTFRLDDQNVAVVPRTDAVDEQFGTPAGEPRKPTVASVLVYIAI